MSNIFPRNCRITPPVAVAGEGCFLIDKSGKRYFDGSGGEIGRASCRERV